MQRLLSLALLIPGADSLLVSTAWLAAQQADPGLVVLHVAMDRAEYDRGHVPGARWLDPHHLMAMTAPGVELPPVQQIDSVLESLGISDASRIVYYGDTWMTPRVFLALEYVGLGDRSALLDGGLPLWRQENRAVTTETAGWTRGQLNARAHPEIIAEVTWLQPRLADARLLLLDGRSAGEYSGADLSERLPRSGHIPGAVNLPWERTFENGAAALEGTPSRLQSPEVLRRLLAEAGVAEGKELITYCTVGLRASHLYFIARYLGWRPRLYDGSMSEWSRKPELPMSSGPNPR
jgi:thiosulfate/3-mercaptopyruvate sulfurtransferase